MPGEDWELERAFQEQVLKTPVGEGVYREGRFLGYHAGGGGLRGGWQCSKGHMVDAFHSGCPVCSAEVDGKK